MMLKVGKLYQCKDYFLMFYPDPETAAIALAAGGAAAVRAAARRPGAAAFSDAFWSNRLGKPVFYIEKNIPFLVLNSKEKFYEVEVLVGDRKGWIICEDWLNIKEIV
jgi:hypothetical protein